MMTDSLAFAVGLIWHQKLVFGFTLGFNNNIAGSDAGYCSRCHRVVVRPSVCPSVTLVYPVKAVGRNDIHRAGRSGPAFVIV